MLRKRRLTIPQHRRRGSLYIVVVGTAMIVSLIGLASLSVQRVARRGHAGDSDVVEARLLAQAALRLGMQRIESNSTWRHIYGTNGWPTNVPLGNGMFSIEARDPSDGNMTDDSTDPIVLVGIGRKGSAVQKTEITLLPGNHGLKSLEVAMHAGRDFDIVEASTFVCAGTVSANRNIREQDNSDVYADVEASGTVTGTFRGSVKSGVPTRALPDSSTVFDYYKNHGTWIDIAEVTATPYPEMIKNSGIEDGTSDWYGTDCQVQTTTSSPKSGDAALAVRSRASASAAGVQDITARILSGKTYTASGWVRGFIADYARFGIRIQSSVETTTHWINIDLVNNGIWNQVSGTVTPTWNGTLIKAELVFSTIFNAGNFDVDAVSLREQTTPAGVVARRVLSPASNPYGQPNAEGIYVFNCHGQPIHFEDCRLVGTIVVLDPGSGSSIRGVGIDWCPAVPGYPVLMVKGDFTVHQTPLGLNENQRMMNYNPPGTPSGGSQDSDLSDSYADRINGLVYISGDAQLYRDGNWHGVMIVGRDIWADGVMTFGFDPSYAQSPPPGFGGVSEIRVLLKSARKAID